MEELKLDGLIIIKDSIGCSGERLWLSFIEKARRSFSQIRLLLTVTWADRLERRFGCVCKEGTSLENIDGLENLLKISRKITSDPNQRTAFFLDSMNVPFKWPSTSEDEVIRLMKNLSVRGGALIARIHDEDLSEALWKRLCSVADVVMCIRWGENRTCLCETIYYKKSGRKVKKLESFKVDSHCNMSCKPLLDEKKSSAVVSETAKADSNTNPLEDLIVPFDIGLQLSESELKAKRNLKLPYMAAQTQEGLVGISASGRKKVRVGGRIIYTPDEADDLDDSDPDDDLQI